VKYILVLVLLCSLACSAMEKDPLLPVETTSQSLTSFHDVSSSVPMEDLMEQGLLTETHKVSHLKDLQDRVTALEVSSKVEEKLNSHSIDSQKWMYRRLGTVEGVTGVSTCFNGTVTYATYTLACSILGIFIYTVANGNISFNA